VSNAPGAGQGIAAIGDGISKAMGPIGQLAGQLAGALGPALATLAPIFDELVTAIVQGLLPAITSGALSSTLVSLVQIFGDLVKIAEPLISMLGKSLVNTLIILNPILSALAKFLGSNSGWMKDLTTATWLLTFPVLAVISHLGGFRQALNDVHNWFFDAWHFINGVWHDIAAVTHTTWLLIKSYVIDPVTDAYHWVVGKFDDVKKFIKNLPSELSKTDLWGWVTTSAKAISAGVSGVFHDMLNGVIKGINWVIDQINGFSHAVSDIWSWTGAPPIDHIDHLSTWKATGGPIVAGLNRIGEAGREALRMPSGTVVLPNANTESMIQGGAFGGTQQQSQQLEWVGGNAGDEFMRWLRKNIRIVGGGGPNSVQRALGQGT